MKRNHFLLASSAALLLVAVILLRPQTQPTPQTERTAPVSKLTPVAASAPANPQPVSVAAQTPAPLPSNEPQREESPVEAATAPEPRVVGIRGDQVLATVNGVRLTLADLMPVKPAATNETRTLETDMYEMLLSRAMVRELAFQSARAQGLALTEAQRQSLAKRRAQNGAAEAGEFDNLGRSAVNGEFEERDTAGLMLLHNLATASGVPSPHVTTDQVGQYYAQHQAEFPVIPREETRAEAVATAIDAAIRNRLAQETKTRHADQFRRFVEQLKAGAQITLARPA